MAEEKRKAYEKAQKLKLKGKTPTEMLASKQANAAELAKADSEYNHWQRMANVEQSRQNAIRVQQEAEARQRASGEQNQTGTEPSERGGGTEGNGGNNRNDGERQNDLQKIIEIDGAERTEMEARIVDWLSEENLSRAAGKTRAEIFEEFGNKLEPIAYIPTRFISLVSPTLKDQRIYCGKGYFIDYALRNHGGVGTQISPEDVDVSKYLNIQSVLDNPDAIKETMSYGKRPVVFIKKIGRFFAELTQVEEDGKIVLHKSLFNQKKEPYAKLNDIRQEDTSSEGGTSSISHAENSAPAISLQSRGDAVSSEKNEHTEKPSISSDKGTTLPADRQNSAEENSEKVVDSEGKSTLQGKIDAASADVNTDPTDAQKEAGNYKKGHVQVGTFDITIEQPEGSIRRGTDADGKQWESKMNNTYGYIRGAVGVDGDHIDVFLSNDIDGWNGRKVFVVDQYNPYGSFDEHKVMLGFNNAEEAKRDYLANYEKGWENGRRIDVTAVSLEDFEKWIESSKRKNLLKSSKLF